jgi:hypothetical protein
MRLGDEFFVDCSQIHVKRLLEPQALLARERFAGLAKTDPAILG